MARIAPFVFLSFLFSLLGACTEVELYRSAGPSSDACAFFHEHPTALADRNNVEKDLRAGPGGAEPWRCMIQAHVSDPKLRKPLPEVTNQKSAFTLSFVEFDENGLFLDDGEQKKALFDHLNKQKQNIVVVFVHGWRHNADIDDSNVQDFRIFLSYTKSFLEQRCKEGRYCDASLTGVYIGWRGQELKSDNFSTATTMMVAPTIISRKKASDKIAHRIVKFLKCLDGRLRLRAGAENFFQQDKMIVVGHSLGGNILANGLREDFLRVVQDHQPGKTMASPLGDLVVLYNPASEASNWTDIQRAALSAQKSEIGNALPSIGYFNTRQRPIYLSLTSACYYPESELKDPDLKDRKIQCDTATGLLFPIYKSLAFDWQREHRTTIGHLFPLGVNGNHADVGATHALEINGADGKPTDYLSGSNSILSQCRTADGWLTRAKRREKTPRWDAGYLPFSSAVGNALAVDPINDRYFNEQFLKTHPSPTEKQMKENLINAQFIHGAARSGPTITPVDDPFWNVRALDTAVINHGGIFSYATWCAVNQLVLDDVTAEPKGPDSDIWKAPGNKFPASTDRVSSEVPQ